MQKKIDWSWVYYLWKQSSDVIEGKYSSNGWMVQYSTAEMKNVDGRFDLQQDILTIIKGNSAGTTNIALC